MKQHRLERFVERSLFPLMVLLVWQLAAGLELVHPYLLPSPLRVGRAALQLFLNGELFRHLGISFMRVCAGFFITLLIALPMGFGVYALPRLKRILKVPLEFLRSVPPLAAVPLLILWFGIGEASKTAVIVMASFFPVFLNLMGGLNSLDGRWKELAETLELDRSDFVRHILFPAAFPSFLTGVQLGISYCWRALMGAEMVAASSGLGYLILDSQEMGRIDRVFVGIFSLGLCGLLLDQSLLRIFDRLIPWKDLGKERQW